MRTSSNFNRIVIVLLVTIIPFVSSAYSFKVDGLCYNKNSDGSTVTVTYERTSLPSYSNLIGDIIIPPNVTFNNKSYVVTSIGEIAFKEYSGITSVVIPNTVKTIDEGAFVSCEGLTSVTIGDAVTSISNWAFCSCNKLSSITIPKSVKSLGLEVFIGCNSLESVTWNAKNCSIYGFDTFGNKTGITSFTFGNEVESIPAFICDGFSGLTSIKVPNSVETIGKNAFSRCTGLTSVTLGDYITEIGMCAFSDCPNIQTIHIPKYLNTIGVLAFSGCTELLSIIVDDENDVFDSRDSCNAIIEKSTNKMIVGCQSTKIPDSISSIGYACFYDCSTLSTITIPSSIVTIGKDAFYGCSGLSLIDIPNSVNTIGEEAFYNCSGLTSATIGNSVTLIEDKSFSGCSGLTSITNYTAEPQSINESVFNGVEIGKCKLFVWHESIDAYKAANIWKNFKIQDLGEVEGVEVDEASKEVEGYYDLKGVRLEEPAHGQVNIVRYTDGSTNKIVVE